MFRNLFLIGAVLALGGVGTAKDEPLSPQEQTKIVLQKGTDVVLYSLDPEAKADKNNALHSWKILGSTALKDADTRKQILTIMEKNISDPKAVGAKCFEPRHALQITHEKQKYDILICFECHWAYVYREGKMIGRMEMGRDSKQDTFDKVLTDAKVPLPKQAKD